MRNQPSTDRAVIGDRDALAWLAPDVLAPARWLTATALTSSELRSSAAAVYEGLLHEVAPGTWAPRDLLRTPRQRAESLAPLLPAQAVVIRASAAWVHAGAIPPRQVTVALPRGGGTPRRHVVTHVARLPPEATATIGGIAVTTPLRTACDLLRFAPEDVAFARLRALLRAGLPVDDVEVEVHRMGGLPGARRAARLLASAEGQQVVARSGA